MQGGYLWAAFKVVSTCRITFKTRVHSWSRRDRLVFVLGSVEVVEAQPMSDHMRYLNMSSEGHSKAREDSFGDGTM